MQRERRQFLKAAAAVIAQPQAIPLATALRRNAVSIEVLYARWIAERRAVVGATGLPVLRSASR